MNWKLSASQKVLARQERGPKGKTNGDDEMFRTEGSGQVCVEVRRGKVCGILKSN